MLFLYAVALGAAHVFLFASLPHPLIYVVVGSVVLLCLTFVKYERLRPFAVAVSFARFRISGVRVDVVAAFCLGAVISIVQLNSILERQLPHNLDRQDFEVAFNITSAVKRDQRAARFDATILSLRCLKRCDDSPWFEHAPGLSVRLSWYYPPKNLSSTQSWKAVIRLKRPRGFVNPGGFDYHAWLLSKGVVATGYVRPKAGFSLIGNREQSTLLNLQRSISEFVNTRTESGHFLENVRFFEALLVGDKSGFKRHDWEVLQKTGTVHLMAISGLHVGLIAGIGFFLGFAVTRVVSGLATHFFSPRYYLLPPTLLSSTFALGYAALAGFSVSTQRACLAVFVVNIAILLGFRLDRFHMLALVLVMVSFIEPLCWVSSGFWLSFLAVAVLIYTFGARSGERKMHQFFRAQMVLAIGLLLPLLLVGQAASLLGPLANTVAVPVMSVLIVPGLFLALVLDSIGLGFAVLQGIDYLYTGLWQFLTWLSELSFALVWPAKLMDGATVALVSVGTLFLLLPSGLGLRVLGGGALVLAMLSPPKHFDEFNMTVLDVGQGLAVVLASKDYTLVYDTGPAFSDNFDAGARIVLPYLRTRGIQTTDLIVSHGDNDHAGGLKGLSKGIRIDNLWHGEALPGGALHRGVNRLRQTRQTTKACQAGQVWTKDRVDYAVLWPNLASGLSESNSNNRSCVVLITFENTTILLTGDIDKHVERVLIDSDVLPRSIDVLIAPHHGSKTSSSQTFVDYLQPRYVVFSAGFKNRYHHPNKQVEMRYRAAGVNILNTGEQGAVTFRWKSLSGDLDLSTERAHHQKFWY